MGLNYIKEKIKSLDVCLTIAILYNEIDTINELKSEIRDLKLYYILHDDSEKDI